MTYKILISSRTGNTNMLATRARKALQGHTCVYDGPPTGQTPPADLCLVGFWTDKGNCDAQTANALAQLNGEQVFLFGTAGFGQSESYYRQILGRVASQLGKGNRLVGSYMCQGRMSPAIRKRYEHQLATDPENRQIKEMLANFDIARTHPNQGDLAEFRSILAPLLK